MEQKILEKLKMVKLSDLLHILKFLLALPISMICRRKHKDLWLICDYEMEARDNPYWLFKYIREHHPEHPGSCPCGCVRTDSGLWQSETLDLLSGGF